MKILNQENTALIRQRGIPTRKNIYYRGYKFYPNLNGDVEVMHVKDYKILQEWEAGQYNPPVKICDIEGKGKGVVAAKDLHPGNFICTYSGDIYPTSLPKSSEYYFQISYGPRASEDFGICPDKHWSLGNYINHSDEEANMESRKFLTKNGLVIILSCKKKIIKG